jgi:hypothetical protein
MDKKRSDLSDLRRQRERFRRVTTGAMVVALLFIIGSCEGLTSRDVNSRRAETTRITAPATSGAPGTAGRSLRMSGPASRAGERR